ncbi:MAG TPA: alpha/beta fold hydrolase, partial [Candidatus Aquilonibacter sp.]
GSSRPSQRITVRDIVRAQRRVFDRLEIPRLAVVIGGSLGGMQALQWALDAPERVAHAIVIGASDHHTAMGIALNAVQREAIALDPVRGVALARKIAMLTYKSEDLLRERHDRKTDRKGRAQFDVEGYLDHQGDAFIERMDGETYTLLTHVMDGFDVRDRTAPPGVDLTFVGISSDWLFRPQEIRAAAKRLPARYLELESNHGHDAFLAEPDRLRDLLAPVVASPTLSPR